MKHTTNYGLKKPDLNDYVQIEDFNENADIIDEKLKENEDAITSLPDNIETTVGSQEKVNAHANKKDNPHAVTKTQVGLSNVDNVKQASKQEFDEHQAEKATLEQEGHVQLSNATNSTSNTLAATPSAVKVAMDRANEAFQSASNGKTLVGNAITGVDDSVVIPTEPTFQQLADAIGMISTGKKWASGTTPTTESGRLTLTSGSTMSNRNLIVVNGLDFLPSVIIIRGNNHINLQFITLYDRRFPVNSRVIQLEGPGSTPRAYSYQFGSPMHVNSNGFKIVADSGSSILGTIDYDWLAIE